MAINVRKQPDAMIFALATAFNDWKREVVEQSTSFPHADTTATQTGDDYRAPTATAMTVITTTANSLATVKAVANDCKRVFNLHCADTCAHKAEDTTNDFTTADLVTGDDQTATDTWLNALKAAVNAHMSQSGVHFTDDATNVIIAADATNLGTSETLVDAIRTAVNAHIAFAPTTMSLNMVDP